MEIVIFERVVRSFLTKHTPIIGIPWEEPHIYVVVVVFVFFWCYGVLKRDTRAN